MEGQCKGRVDELEPSEVQLPVFPRLFWINPNFTEWTWYRCSAHTVQKQSNATWLAAWSQLESAMYSWYLRGRKEIPRGNYQRSCFITTQILFRTFPGTDSTGFPCFTTSFFQDLFS